METKQEVEPASQEVHFLKNKNVIEIIDKKWHECLELLEKATIPEPSENPTEMEAWENGHRLERIKELSETLDYGEAGTLIAIQQLLYEECFGMNAHPEKGTSWWQHSSGAPTPGGEVSHSFPMSVMNGIKIEDCARLPFTGSSAAEMVSSLPDINQKNALAAMIAQLAFPEEIRRINLVTESLVREKTIFPSLVDNINTIGARYLILAKSENLGEDVVDPQILEILGQKPDRKMSKLLAWHLLWNKFEKILTYPSGKYKKPHEPGVEEAIGQLLRVRLSPDFQGLFKHYSLSAYKVENPS